MIVAVASKVVAGTARLEDLAGGIAYSEYVVVASMSWQAVAGIVDLVGIVAATVGNILIVAFLASTCEILEYRTVVVCRRGSSIGKPSLRIAEGKSAMNGRTQFGATGIFQDFLL
jgi:hypothetical protein